jgi:hypothetical protein
VDVDPDKVFRRYHGLDLEVKGFVKGAQGVSLSLACEGVFAPIFHDAIFFSQGHTRLTGIGGQNRDAVRAVPTKDRVANTGEC